MIKHNQDGGISAAAIALIFCIIFLIAALGFGTWAFMGRQDYRNNVNTKISTAVTVAKQQEGTSKDKAFAEKEKSPYRTYAGPGAYGSLNLIFPKTWSGVVDDTGSSGQTLVDGYFYPNIVPSITNQSSTFALRIQVVNQTYSQVLQSLSSLQQNKEKPTAVTPYALPKLPKVVGVQVSGTLPNQKTGLMVVLPLRSQTLELWTEGNTYANDFNNIILPNFSFSP